MNLPKFVTYLAAGFFILYGMGYLVTPIEFSQLVVGNAPSGKSFLIDFRATYGGMTVALGFALIYLFSSGYQRPALVVIIIILMGMAVGRSIGFMVEGLGNQLVVLYLVLEVLGSVLAWVAIQHSD